MNKKLTLLAVSVMMAASALAVLGQSAPTPSTPSISDNASPLDNNIKMRSVEMERVKRDAEKSTTNKPGAEKTPEINREVQSKFPQIKDDFEGIQKEHTEIVNIYTTSDPIDYQGISKAADRITEMALRLRGNVLEPKAEDTVIEDARKKEANSFIGKSARELILALDSAIGEVVTNPIFGNLKVIQPELTESLESSLVKMIYAGSALSLESTNRAGR